METTTLKELKWIHDCALFNIMYDVSSDTGQSIKLAMRCPLDLGYTPWEGKNLRLVMIDVALMKHVAYGVAGPVTIDAIRPGVSQAVQESTNEARRMGILFPNLELTVSFHSGSSLEVICKELRIDIDT